MKKIIFLLLAFIANFEAMAKDDLLNFKYAETSSLSASNDLHAVSLRDPYKAKSKICWISGLALAGSGSMVWLFTGIFNPLAHERDPIRAQEIRREQRTQQIIGTSLIASSIPLFILAKHYSNQGRYKTVLNFKMEPVDGYHGRSSSVAAIGVSIGL